VRAPAFGVVGTEIREPRSRRPRGYLVARPTVCLDRNCRPRFPNGRPGLRQLIDFIGAGEGDRTLVFSLEVFKFPRALNAHSDNSQHFRRPANRRQAIDLARIALETDRLIRCPLSAVFAVWPGNFGDVPKSRRQGHSLRRRRSDRSSIQVRQLPLCTRYHSE
jgi:hypothetical protein